MAKSGSLFDVLERILAVEMINDDLLVELLTTIQTELGQGRKKRAGRQNTIKTSELLHSLKSLQSQVDHGRHRLAFVNRVSRFDDELSPYAAADENEKIEIHFPVEPKHIGKEVFLLLGWSACDRILGRKFSDLRKSARKNGWVQNRRRIKLQFDLVQDWLDSLAQSDRPGFYPYDFNPPKNIDWSMASGKIGKAIAADLKMIDALVTGSWPSKEVNNAYAGKAKADVYFQWSVLVLKKMLRLTQNPKKTSYEIELQKLFTYFNVALDRDSLRAGKSRRRVSGNLPREAPTRLWKSLQRLSSIFP